MGDNTLVAEPEGYSALSGTFLGADLELGAQAIGSGSWMAADLAGVATAVDLAATFADPFGALLSAGFGWLMDHINPLKRWLEDLTGSPADVEAYAKTWENIAQRLEEQAQELSAKAKSQLATASGDAIEAYRSHAESLTKTVESLGSSAEQVGQGLSGASAIIDVVHGIVRDIIAQICAAIVEWAAELVFSFGLATPLVIEQAATKVADGVSKVTSKVTAVVESCQRLEQLLQKLSSMVGDVRSALDKIHPGAARGSHERGFGEGEAPRTHSPDEPTTAGKGDEPAATGKGDEPATDAKGEGGDTPGDNPADNGHTRDPGADNKHVADKPGVLDRAGDIAKDKAGDLPRGAGEDVVTETSTGSSKQYQQLHHDLEQRLGGIPVPLP